MSSDDFKTIILQKNIYVTNTCPSFDFRFCIIAHDLQYWAHSESGSVGALWVNGRVLVWDCKPEVDGRVEPCHRSSKWVNETGFAVDAAGLVKDARDVKR